MSLSTTSFARPQSRMHFGFTIVELLIVIVVIGILAAITIVAYNGVQQRGRDAARSSAVKNIKTALELYKADVGNYPSCVGISDHQACTDINSTTSGLASILIPKYVSSIPNDPSYPTKTIQYARNTDGIGYALNVYYESGRCIAGVNPNTGLGWYSGGATPSC